MKDWKRNKCWIKHRSFLSTPEKTERDSICDFEYQLGHISDGNYELFSLSTSFCEKYIPSHCITRWE